MANRCLVNTNPTQPQICKLISSVDIQYQSIVNTQLLQLLTFAS